jgi:hypothetical protein
VIAKPCNVTMTWAHEGEWWACEHQPWTHKWFCEEGKKIQNIFLQQGKNILIDMWDFSCHLEEYSIDVTWKFTCIKILPHQHFVPSLCNMPSLKGLHSSTFFHHYILLQSLHRFSISCSCIRWIHG